MTNVDVTIDNKIEDNGISKYEVTADISKMLLAESASDLPYIAGLEESAKMLRSADVDLSVEYKKQEIEDFYIGVEQMERANFNVYDDGSEYTLFFVDEFGNEYPADIFKPDSENDMYRAGQEAAAAVSRAAVSTRAINTDVQSYDRVMARNYARNWALGRNPAYSDYTGYGGDCANFVSQCMYEGGMPTSSTWYKDSLIWIRAVDLHNYMVNNNYCFETYSKYKAYAGSIISWTSCQHVGLVDHNDTVTMTYCAHTNDRLSLSFKNFTDVKFAVSWWDSYTGTWNNG